MSVGGLVVIKQQGAERMLQHFKLLDQGYPDEMVEKLREMWEEKFGDISEAGLLLVDKKALQERAKVGVEFSDLMVKHFIETELLVGAEK